MAPSTKDAVRVPATVGLNRTVTVQMAFASTLAQLLDALKSLVFAPVKAGTVKESVAAPVLVSCTVRSGIANCPTVAAAKVVVGVPATDQP